MAEELKKPVTGGSNDVEENKVIALLSYIIFFIPFLMAKDSPFVKYHAKQGLILFLFEVIIGVVSGIFVMVTLGFGALIAWVLYIPPFVFAIMGIMNAWNGKMVPLPMIGQYADKINL